MITEDAPATRAATDGSTRTQLICVWCGPAAVLLFLVFFWLIAGFVPPPSPHWSAQHVARFFAAHRTAIRVGQIGGMVAVTLFFPFYAVISVQIARIEGRRPVLALTQFGAGVLLLAFFYVCSMLWIVASFRSAVSPATVRTLNDLAWLIFVMVFPEYTLQMICIAAAGFRDRTATPTWPRWACYLCLWIGVSGMGGGLAVFFQHGPFAWNGLIGFYVPISMFVVWLGLMCHLLTGAIRRQALAERDTAGIEAALG